MNLPQGARHPRCHIIVLLIVFLAHRGQGTDSCDAICQFRHLSATELSALAIQKPKGTLVEAVRWTDKSGDNLIVISEYQTGNILEPGYSSELFAAQWLITAQDAQEVWKIKDFNYVDGELDYTAQTLDVQDIDKDGVAESSFLYTIVSSDKQTTKMMLHTRGTKLAIRGHWNIDIDADEPELDTITVDDLFKKYPRKFETYAQQRWKRLTED